MTFWLKTIIITALFFVVGCHKKAEVPVEATPEVIEQKETIQPILTVEVDPIEEILKGMSLEDKLTQMMMPAFRVYTDETGSYNVTELNDDIKQLLETYAFGGVILFDENMEHPDQTKALINSLQEANQKAEAVSQLIISTDQEGGVTTRIPFASQTTGAMALAATNKEENATKMANLIGSELKELGIHLDFAPVLDINNQPANPIIGIRSFSDDPVIVSNHGKAFIEGLHQQNTMAAIKHFPGHGDTNTDSHTGLPLIDKSLEEIQENELIPFIANLENADVVMMAHIQYPQIETEKVISIQTGEEIYLPATLSNTFVHLLEEKGYQGVIITDAMNMDALANHFELLDASKRAINAGVSMLLMPMEMSNQEQINAFKEYLENLKKLVEDKEIDEEKINEAITKILRLKDQYGLLDSYKPTSVDEPSLVGSIEHHDIEWEIALEVTTLLKNENQLLPLNQNQSVAIIYPYDSQGNSIQYALNKLKEKEINIENIKLVCINGLTPETVVNEVSSFDVVVGISNLYYMTSLNPNVEDNQFTRVYDAVSNLDNAFVLVSAQLPYDTARYNEADAILACYNGRGMVKMPVEGEEITQYGPNIPATIYTIFGGYNPTGVLPVDIPKIDENYVYTNEIQFERGTGLSFE